MSEPCWIWGHNPGQRYVKDCIAPPEGTRRDCAPYPAVIAPWQKTDELGLARKTRDLTAMVDGALYLGGALAERLPLANRQLVNGRLEPDSPVYQAFAQMSAQHVGLTKAPGRPSVLIATALPVAWREPTAEAALAAHIRAGLRDRNIHIRDILIQSEPNAVVSSEILDDAGALRSDQTDLATGLVCVGDLGGGTLNRSVLERLKVLPGQSASPLLGSRQVVEALMQISGQQYVDAEQRLAAAARTPGNDGPAETLLRQYQEAVVAELQRAWATFKPAAYLFAGGTVQWVEPALRRAFGGRCRVVKQPQQAIAVGLWRYARRKAARSA